MPVAAINGANLYYEISGQGDPLVMIQGFGGGQRSWASQIRVFGRHFRVVTFDARGLGKSDVSKEPYTMTVMTQDVIGLMDHLDIKKAHILGVSLGGLVAQSIAINHPTRVVKLILVSTFPNREMTRHVREYFGNSSNVNVTDVGSTEFMKYMLDHAFNNKLYKYMLKLIIMFSGKDEYANYGKQMRTMGNFSALDQLHLIQAPTLVITGTNDRLVPQNLSEILASGIPNARLVKVEGGSHALFLEMKKTFNQEVLRFLL